MTLCMVVWAATQGRPYGVFMALCVVVWVNSVRP